MVKASIIGKGNFGSKIQDCLINSVQFVEPDEADWIIIATPNDLHGDLVEKWLMKKKNVFCEKPLTLSYQTSDNLFNIADFVGKKLYVDDVFTWHQDLAHHDEYLWYKKGSFNANIIDNLAYHHFYLWLGVDDFEVKKIDGQYLDETKSKFTIELKDGRVCKFDYDINVNKKFHTIPKPTNNPLKEMLTNVLNDKADYDSKRKRTLNATKMCEVIKSKIFPRVLVVGGGIFGGTAGIELSTRGYNVTLHEELDDLMKCASGINQYRLHKGYHYPRSKETTSECLVGIKSFKRKYEECVVNGNIKHSYAIAEKGSLVDSGQYLDFLNDMDLNYKKTENLKGSQLTVDVNEQLFDSQKLREIIKRRLSFSRVNVIYNKSTTTDDFNDYDFVVISTYSKINDLLKDKRQYQYEVIEKPVVRLPRRYKDKSIVVMDGPFMCLDPFEDDLHVLGHVKHAIHSTNVGTFPIIPNKDIKSYLNRGVITNPKVTKIKKFIEAGQQFFEEFDNLEHVGSMFTIRTVLSNRDFDDARPTLVNKIDDKVFTIFSGKIGTCVESSNQLLKLIRSHDD